MQEVADELHHTYGTRSYCYAADLSDSIMLSYFLEALPDMDVIINNAGISHVGLLTDMTLAEWNHIFQTNLTSVFVICQKLLPAMIRRGQGKIINISLCRRFIAIFSPFAQNDWFLRIFYHKNDCLSSLITHIAKYCGKLL